MELIDWTGARFFFEVLKNAFLLGVGVYVWWTNRNRATSAAIREVHLRLDEVDRHVSRLEQTLDNRPGYGEIDKLRAEMAEMNRGMAQVSAQLQSTTSLLNRLHEYMLQERGNR
ncbi:conserved hypothetical protein [Thioalkalivibrio sulfidiphilus HL-EbGr7]|uniref:DUF2730 family protein n=1 Tax=Thioalkalivibrio sulfidiphilus (strain HL-EbGR7) TaxID=396588 RepID=B8GS24_THISH|nr:hypothetical protein [Thioalkalivibrio sulfidiphilus]ACL72728.1 conserved hypothetical protein [Thioalkalivibrio sulfidiphilus HL-EbGr7]